VIRQRRSTTASRVGPIVVVLAAALVALGAAVAPATTTSAFAAARLRAGHTASSLRVGTEVLKLCGRSPAAYCGTLKVPLDWAATAGPDISVCFRWYPATGSGQPDGTVLPVEGGPGYPSILSVAPDGYGAMYGAVLEHFNMLAVDLRGTGCSTVLNCPALQDFSGPSGTPAFAAVVGACADALNKRWRLPGGGYIHASDLFTSAPAAEDLAAVIHALDVRHVDLYGDSYGSWFAQVFAARYPSLVRSVILDSTYQVQALDPWYRITIATMPGDFDTACALSTACAAVGGTSWPRIEALASRLSSAPISGAVPGPNGTRQEVRMGVVGLVNLVSDSAEDPTIYAELDAAARALLDDDQPAPLLRLYAQRLAIDEAYFGVPVTGYSVELYMAVSCLDYPQLYPLSASERVRAADLAAAKATLPADTFAPFTTAEWLAMDQNTENYTACLDWPKPTISEVPIPTSPPFLPASTPVLILGGELDTWTPPAGVPEVEAEVGGDDRFVEFANETHVVGEGDPYGCASSIIQAFVTDPAALSQLDVSCAADIPSVRAVGSYASRLSSVVPLTLTSGSAGVTTLELAAAALHTAGDAVSRFESIGVTIDSGLYGGSVQASGQTLTLSDDELVPGVKVSGTVTITGHTTGRTVRAALRTQVSGLAEAYVSGSWLLYGGSATATATVTSGGVTGSGSMPAP
jgi:pimeloyl-ACP methyl ester carboxylesterase